MRIGGGRCGLHRCATNGAASASPNPHVVVRRISGERRKTAGLGHGAKAPRCQGAKVPSFRYRDLGSRYHDGCLNGVRSHKEAWVVCPNKAPFIAQRCKPFGVHHPCFGAPLNAKTNERKQQRQKRQTSDDCCKAHICAYRPLSASKAACDPRSTMRPASSTKISWASTTVDKRWAITKVVLLCAALCNSP